MRGAAVQFLSITVVGIDPISETSGESITSDSYHLPVCRDREPFPILHLHIIDIEEIPIPEDNHRTAPSHQFAGGSHTFAPIPLPRLIIETIPIPIPLHIRERSSKQRSTHHKTQNNSKKFNILPHKYSFNPLRRIYTSQRSFLSVIYRLGIWRIVNE